MSCDRLERPIKDKVVNTEFQPRNQNLVVKECREGQECGNNCHCGILEFP